MSVVADAVSRPQSKMLEARALVVIVCLASASETQRSSPLRSGPTQPPIFGSEVPGQPAGRACVPIVVTMAHVAVYRVRWFREIDRQAVSGGVDLEALVQGVLGGNPTLAATVEADNGDGPALLVAVGGGHHLLTDYWGEDLHDLVLRLWTVEDAAEDISAADTPRFVLGPFDEALWESGVRGVRLLTAEQSDDEDGRAVVLSASWYDSDEYEAKLREYDDELDEDEDDGDLDELGENG